MNKALVAACFALVVFGNSPTDLPARQVELQTFGNSVAWRVSPGVPEGSVAGMVLTEAGMPLAGVRLYVEGARTGVVAVTMEDGSFTLAHRPGKSHLLRIARSGYLDLLEPVLLPADRGIFLIAILQSRDVHTLCGEVVCDGTTGCGDLNVQVVEAATGFAPDALVTIRVEHESGVFVNSMALTPRDLSGSVGLGRSIETEGNHSIEISAPGYRTWRRDNVQLELVPGCIPRLLNRDHRAELIRVDGPQGQTD